jgi:hypothetical protein
MKNKITKLNEKLSFNKNVLTLIIRKFEFETERIENEIRLETERIENEKLEKYFLKLVSNKKKQIIYSEFVKKMTILYNLNIEKINELYNIHISTLKRKQYY